MAPESRKWKSRDLQSAGLSASNVESGVSKELEKKKPSDSLPIPHLPAKRDTNDWIAEVSHELRLPIANLKLLVETLLDGALEDIPTSRHMLGRAKTEVERLQSLVVNLLSIEKVAATRKEVHCLSIPFAQRVSYSLEAVSKLAIEKKIAITTEIDAAHRVFANPEMFDQVLLNLLENAVKFTLPGGSVKIQSGSLNGQFSVTDTGIGMAAQEIPKIFQRFYRIDRAQSKGSTGLGLSIVKHIVDLHGAKITVKSEEGKGTTFELLFPDPI